MREYRGPRGERRLWYDPAEIESLIVDELKHAGLLPDSARRDVSVDVEAFVESYLHLPFDISAELEPDILGVTYFVPGREPKICVNRELTGGALDDEDATPGMIGRWRATVAHEACHVLLHRQLFEWNDQQPGLFPVTSQSESAQELHRCLKRDVGFSHQASDWREIQANMGMSALLMPKPVFCDVVDEERARIGATNTPIVDGSSAHQQLVGRLASRFIVSHQAARIRLKSLGVTRAANQFGVTLILTTVAERQRASG